MDNSAVSMDDIIEQADEGEFTTPGEVLEKLEEIWINEKFAPDLLQYEGDIVECMIDQVEHMEKNLQQVKRNDLRTVIHNMEVNRIRYVINSYLRTRLQKIEKYAAYLVNEVATRHELMSENEYRYATRYIESIRNYLHSTCLRHMPGNMKDLDMNAVGMKPNIDSYVFLMAKEHCPGVILEEQTLEGREEEIVDLEANSQHLMKYKAVSSLLSGGSVVLI